MAAKIDPKTASLAINETLQLSVSPKPATPVTYAVTGSSGGTVDANGLYTASGKPGTDAVTARTNGEFIDTTTVTVTA